jgi:hypothetical protein
MIPMPNPRSLALDTYPVIVRLDNGARVAVGEVGEGPLRVGDRVRVEGNYVYRGLSNIGAGHARLRER